MCLVQVPGEVPWDQGTLEDYSYCGRCVGASGKHWLLRSSAGAPKAGVDEGTRSVRSRACCGEWFSANERPIEAAGAA